MRRTGTLLPVVGTLFLIVSIPLYASLAGCGGGSGGSGGGNTTPSPTPTPLVTRLPRVTVSWGMRSRGTVTSQNLSSPLSFVITLSGIRASDNGEIRFLASRPDGTSGTTVTYTLPEQAIVGRNADFAIQFYAGPGGTGDVVARAQSAAVLQEDQRLIFAGNTSTIAVNGLVHSVAVNPDQEVGVGQSKDIDCTVRDASGNLLAVSPGSLFLTPTTANTLMDPVSGGSQIRGRAPGNGSITARVDGITSPEVSVRVTSDTTVTITPGSGIIPVNEVRSFEATVGGANPTNRDVQWSVREGDTGGTITASGLYTAPPRPGIFHIIATSVYDPSKSATVTMDVRSGGLIGIID